MKMNRQNSAESAAELMRSLPPIIENHTEFTVWILNKVRKFNKDIRFSFGQRLAQRSLDTGDLLIEAFYSPDTVKKEEALCLAGIALEQLRLLLRMSYNMRLINAGSLNYASERLMTEGKMLGGWIKSAKNRSKHGKEGQHE